MRKDGLAYIRTDPLPDPGNEIKAHKRTDGEQQYKTCKEAQRLHQYIGFATGKTAVDDEANALSNRQCSASGYHQGNAGKNYLAQVGPQKFERRG